MSLFTSYLQRCNFRASKISHLENYSTSFYGFTVWLLIMFIIREIKKPKPYETETLTTPFSCLNIDICHNFKKMCIEINVYSNALANIKRRLIG